MKPTVTAARRCCEAMGARQVVVVAFDRERRWAVVSYGTTKPECAAVAKTCDAVADALEEGCLPLPVFVREAPHE